MAAADPYIMCNIFHGDRVGVIGGDKFNPLLHIAVCRVLCVCVRCPVQKERKHGVKPSCHLDGVLKFVAACIVNVQDLAADGIAKRRVSDKRNLRRKVGRL